MACGWVPSDVNNTQAVTTLISPPQNISYVDSTHSCPTPPQTGRLLRLKVIKVGGRLALNQD